MGFCRSFERAVCGQVTRLPRAVLGPEIRAKHSLPMFGDNSRANILVNDDDNQVIVGGDWRRYILLKPS